MLDLLLIATMLLICGGIGLPLAQLLPRRFAWRLLIAPALGMCVLAAAVPVAYRGGVSILHFFVAALVLALGLFGVYAKSTLQAVRRGWIVVAVCALAMLVLIAPRWVGGDQFSVFQGNQWDTYGYLSSALVYARKPFSLVSSAKDYDIMRMPLYSMAPGQLTQRPSVHQLYAVFSRISPGEAYRLYYPFLVCCFVQVAQVLMFVLRNLFPAGSQRAWLAIALVFPLGFWGQYVFDINAWSQIASQPSLLLMFGLTIHALARAEMDLRDAARIAGVLAIAVAGALYIYPEGFLIYTAALGPICVLVVVGRIIVTRRFALAPIVPLLGYLGVASVVLYPPQVTFLMAQVKWSAGYKVTWWQFFQGFFWGRDARVSHGFARFADFVAGFFGLYFATPKAGAGILFGSLRRIAILATVAGAIGSVAWLLAGRIRVACSDRARTHVALWTVAVMLMLVPAVRLALDENYWPAGKIVAYASPVLMTLICIPAGFVAETAVARWLRRIVIAFIAFQLMTGFARIGAASRRYGIHYASPYPALQAPELKKQRVWNLEALEAIPPGTKVLMRPMDVWAQGYLMCFLYSRRIPFAIDGKFNTYFGSGRDLPGLPPPWTPDAEITVEPNKIVVTFRDGRPSLRVVSDEDLM